MENFEKWKSENWDSLNKFLSWFHLKIAEEDNHILFINDGWVLKKLTISESIIEDIEYYAKVLIERKTIIHFKNWYYCEHGYDVYDSIKPDKD